MIKAVLLDFGGVIAEEDFREGLFWMAKKTELTLMCSSASLMNSYIQGESSLWAAIRETTGIIGTDADLREKILNRFIVRPRMIEPVDRLRANGIITGILSDQTDWLDMLNEKTGFYEHFDYVFKSHRTHISKRDPSVFTYVCEKLGCEPDTVLFVDDNSNNIERARSKGSKTTHFKRMDDFEKQLDTLIDSKK